MLDLEKIKPRLDRLKQLRTKTDLVAPPNDYLRTHFANGSPLTLRTYQVQGIMHLVTMERFVLGDDTGLGKCVTGDTLINTDKGLVEIATLNPNITEADTFAPLQEPLNVIVRGEKRPIKNFYYGGIKPTVKLKTRYGFELEGSQVHPVLVRQSDGVERWVKLSEIKEGDYICIDRTNSLYGAEKPISFVNKKSPNQREYKTPTSFTPELGMFLGYLLAEGWFNDPRGYHFSVTQDKNLNPEVCSHIESLTSSLFDYPIHYRKGSYQYSSTFLFKFLEGLGVKPCLSKDKEIPMSVLGSTKEVLAGFLKTFIDSESYVKEGIISVSSASEKMLKQVQIALLSFGIVSRRRTFKVKGRSETYWELAMFGANALRFLDTIGLVSARKIAEIEKHRETPKNPNHDVIPYSQGYIEEVRAEVYSQVGLLGFKGKGISTKYGNTFYNTLGHIRAGRRNPSFNYLNNMKEVLTSLSIASSSMDSVINNHYFYDPVVNIEKSEKEVFDIEVDHPEHSFVGNGITSHNTLQTIASLTYVWQKDPTIPVLILTTKSAVGQWASEFDKFTTGVTVHICQGTKAKREKVYSAFEKASTPKVLVMGYRTACQDFAYLQKMHSMVTVFDEATAFKNDTSQVHQVCAHLSGASLKVWSLSATIIKNKLMEAWAIYKVTVPGLFSSKAAFMRDYCVTKDQPIGGGRKIKIVVGYKKRDIEAFREVIDPFFIGRPKHEVAKELPMLTSKNIEVELSDEQKAKYKEALKGLLETVDKETGELKAKEVTQLTAVTICQQIVNHPKLVEVEGSSGKLDALVEMLEEEFEGDKVIVFSRFRQMIDILENELESKGIKTCRITGAETGELRLKSQQAFQDPENPVRVCLITMAAAEGVNLQLAKAVIFYDTPWSAGDYLQIIGRMIRIGSVHENVFSYHLVAPKTIDDRVIKTLNAKMTLIESVLGKRLKSEGDGSETIVNTSSELADLFAGLLEDAQDDKIIKVK